MAAPAAAVLAVGAFPATAAAHEFDGDTHWHDEPGRGHTLSVNGPVSVGNVVGMFQQIMWNDGVGLCTDVDGGFGSRTTDFTKVWQVARGLSPTGVVNDATWLVARSETERYEVIPGVGEYWEHYNYEDPGAPGTMFHLFNRYDPGGTWKWELVGDWGNYLSTGHPTDQVPNVC